MGQPVDTLLTTKATLDLQKEIEEELNIDDPDEESAKAHIRNNNVSDSEQ